MKRCLVSMLTATAVGLVGCLGIVQVAHAVEILRWERLPLAVPLVVGEERVVFIDRNVRVGLPGDLGARLRVQSAGGAIYIRANEELPPTRLQLQDVATGRVILLDVEAKAPAKGAAPLEPVRIVLDAHKLEETREGPDTTVPRPTPVPVLLTRYAAQNLYAPLRTIEPVAGIGRVNLRGNLPLDTLLPTLPVDVRPLGAWRLEDHWVTAMQLRNTATRCVGLDPRALQGDFVAATFQHAFLGPAGLATDTTVVYLVTRGRGVAGALLPSISRFDASLNLPAPAPDAPLDTVVDPVSAASADQRAGACHAK